MNKNIFHQFHWQQHNHLIMTCAPGFTPEDLLVVQKPTCSPPLFEKKKFGVDRNLKFDFCAIVTQLLTILKGMDLQT